MSESISRICPYCAEDIQAAAKVCPHCRQWLSAFSPRSPVFFMMVFTLAAVVWGILLLHSIRQLLNPGVDFSPFRTSISVEESQMNFQTDDKKPRVFVVMLLTNSSDVAWSHIETDIRFYNKAGALIDSRMGLALATIYPHGELAYRADSDLAYPSADYNSYKIFVSWARDAHARF